MDCIFCKIIDGEIPSKKVYEDENVLCIYDIMPQAPIHVLLMPKKHVSNLLEVDDDDMMNNLLNAIKHITKKLKIDDSGFRTVINTGDDAAQSVKHLHFHILGRKKLGDNMV